MFISLKIKKARTLWYWTTFLSFPQNMPQISENLWTKKRGRLNRIKSCNWSRNFKDVLQFCKNYILDLSHNTFHHQLCVRSACILYNKTRYTCMYLDVFHFETKYSRPRTQLTDMIYTTGVSSIPNHIMRK